MAEMRRREEMAREQAFPMRVVSPETAPLLERVHWSPIVGGTVVALAVELVLSSIGVAIGFIPTATSATDVTSISTAFGIWLVITAGLALLIGGYVAGRLMAAETPLVGAIHGVAVWALAILLGTIFVAFFGISGFLGFTGNAAAALRWLIGFVSTPTSAELGAVDALARSSTAWFIFWSLVALVTAAAGGYLGMIRNLANRNEVP